MLFFCLNQFQFRANVNYLSYRKMKIWKLTLKHKHYFQTFYRWSYWQLSRQNHEQSQFCVEQTFRNRQIHLNRVNMFSRERNINFTSWLFFSIEIKFLYNHKSLTKTSIKIIHSLIDECRIRDVNDMLN